MARYRYNGLDVVHVPALGLEFLKPGTEFETDAEVNNPIFEPLDPAPKTDKSKPADEE